MIFRLGTELGGARALNLHLNLHLKTLPLPLLLDLSPPLTTRPSTLALRPSTLNPPTLKPYLIWSEGKSSKSEAARQNADEVMETVVAKPVENSAAGADSDGAVKVGALSAFAKLWKLRQTGDILFVITGLVACTISSASVPLQGYAITKLFFIFFFPNPDDIFFATFFWACNLIGLCALSVLGKTMENFCFGTVNAHLTKRLRKMALRHLIKQEIAYFDEDHNSAGELTEFLSSKITLVQGMCAEKLQVIIGCLIQLGLGFVLMFGAGDWRIGAMATAAIPLIGLGMAAEIAAASGKDLSAAKEDEGGETRKFRTAGALVGEVVTGIRTVASFNAEQRFYKDYCDSVDAMYIRSFWAIQKGGEARHPSSHAQAVSRP